MTLVLNEWSVGPPDRDGWHPVGVREIETTRAGAIVKRRGIFTVRATVFDVDDALMVAAAFANANGDELRGQTADDLRHPARKTWCERNGHDVEVHEEDDVTRCTVCGVEAA